jgi:hypothetical protein
MHSPAAQLSYDSMSQIVQRGLGVEPGLGRQALEDLRKSVGVDGATVTTVTYDIAMGVVPARS